MAALQLDLDEALVTLLENLGSSAEHAAHELIVLGLYGQRIISSGKAAELLGMRRFDFVRYASQLGIPFFDMTEDEWSAELRAVEEIVHSRRLSATPAPSSP